MGTDQEKSRYLWSKKLFPKSLNCLKGHNLPIFFSQIRLTDRKCATPQPIRKPANRDAAKHFLSPNLGGRARKLSKSSEDLIGKSERWAGELRGGLSASLQKDVNLVITIANSSMKSF